MIKKKAASRIRLRVFLAYFKYFGELCVKFVYKVK